MFERIREMLIKEFIQAFRDPRMLVLMIVPPVFQLLVFGYAASTDVKHIATAVYDLDNSQLSRDFTNMLGATEYFDIVAYPRDSQDVIRLVDRDEVDAVFQINKGFSEQIHAGQTAKLQIIVDGTESNTAGVVLSYGGKIAENFSVNLLVERLTVLGGVVSEIPRVELETRTWFNENLESRNFYIPGLIGIIVMLSVLLLTCMAVVREKEIGTMEQVMVTPIRRIEFILGKTVPFALVGLFDMVMITLVGTQWFDVPIRGPMYVLRLGTIFYIMSALGFGLLISTISQTQQQAMMTTFFFFFPTTLLSGFVFPIENMPTVVQWLTYLNPMRYFLIVVRGVFLKGIGLDVLWPQVAALAVMGGVTLLLAARTLQKTMK
jgi:ABC-2 type transport system permease protein